MRFLLNKRQIHRAAARMAGFSGDITEMKKFRFFDVWVVNRFSCVVRKILGPSGKIFYGALGAVSVVKFYKIAFYKKALRRQRKRVRHGTT